VLVGDTNVRLLKDSHRYNVYTAGSLVKYILIYFFPQDASNYRDLNENYPIVTKAKVNSEEFENEDIIDLEILGI